MRGWNPYGVAGTPDLGPYYPRPSAVVYPTPMATQAGWHEIFPGMREARFIVDWRSGHTPMYTQPDSLGREAFITDVRMRGVGS